MKRFLLIDGNAIVHRAFHAMPFFKTSTGMPVGAVYGFTSMLIRAIQDLKPDYLAVAFDRVEPTFRKQLYVGYQATREKMSDDLSPQFQGVYDVLKALSIPMFSVAGYEADDVIGTIAARVKKEIEVIIVSGDRDLLQLVTKNVKVYMPIKGMTETKLYNESDVVEKFGLQPIQVIDLKSLMGDASDNYQGVPGIGPKTASTLLQKYETMEGVYEHIGELSERLQKSLAEGAESAALGKKLATIVCDVPLQFNTKDCVYKIKDVDGAIAVLKSFEFKTLPNRLLELVGREPLEVVKEKSSLTIEKKKDDSGQMGLL